MSAPMTQITIDVEDLSQRGLKVCRTPIFSTLKSNWTTIFISFSRRHEFSLDIMVHKIYCRIPASYLDSYTQLKYLYTVNSPRSPSPKIRISYLRFIKLYFRQSIDLSGVNPSAFASHLLYILG